MQSAIIKREPERKASQYDKGRYVDITCEHGHTFTAYVPNSFVNAHGLSHPTRCICNAEIKDVAA